MIRAYFRGRMASIFYSRKGENVCVVNFPKDGIDLRNLPDDESVLVERIGPNHDESVRNPVARLVRAFDLLDELGEYHVGRDFIVVRREAGVFDNFSNKETYQKKPVYN